MNERRIARLFPNASKSFIKLNQAGISDSRESNQSKQMDQERPSKALRDSAMETQYSLRHIEIEFFANHGKRLDEDNRRYIAKIINDSLVNLGFARDDKDITTETTQRMDKTNPLL